MRNEKPCTCVRGEGPCANCVETAVNQLRKELEPVLGSVTFVVRLPDGRAVFTGDDRLEVEQFARERVRGNATVGRELVGPCPCECNRGQFCGGCGHAGCGGRRYVC